MPGREFCRPDFVVSTGRVAVLPDIANVERVGDNAGADFVAEETIEKVFIERQSALREYGVTKFLELFHNLVIEAWIMVVDATQHHDANAIFALKLIKSFPRLTSNLSLAFE